MKSQNHIPALHAAAAVMLPSIRQARALLDAAIRVCEYFERPAACDVATSTSTTHTGAKEPADRRSRELKALLSAFSKLHEKHS